jgi:hypothetical protein
MSDTPDISKIVNLIMENPHIIKEIQDLAKNEGASEALPSEKATEARENEPVKERHLSKTERREKLLSAMKPYLKEERARSIDTFLTIAEMLDAVRSK